MWGSNVQSYTQDTTHIDHSIGGDAEESCSFVDSLQFICAVSGGPQVLEFTEGALEGGTVLSYQLITGAEVIEFAGQSFERPLDQSTVGLGQRTFIT